MKYIWSKPVKCGRCGKLLHDSDESAEHNDEHKRADQLADEQHAMLWRSVDE